MTVVPGTAEISPATPGLLAGTVETRASWWIACWARRDILGGELHSLLGGDNDAADRA
jgi:hypothetical protein